MVKITVGIEDMACGMCEAHINETVRNVFRVKKVTQRAVHEEKFKFHAAEGTDRICRGLRGSVSAISS